MNEDPLTISATQWRVHVLFEAALCTSRNHQQDCKCATMKRQYGSRLFKCNRLGCPLLRIGFEAKQERDRHLRSHDRPYKCDRPNCDFSQMGFGSQTRLNVHLQYHEKQAEGTMAPPLENKDDDEDLELILDDAVKSNDLDLVLNFVADVPRFEHNLLRTAAVYSSREMLELLLEACNSALVMQSYMLAYAVRADNFEAARMLLDRGASVNSRFGGGECIYHALRNRSPEMIKVLLTYTNNKGKALDDLRQVTLFRKNSTEEDERIIQCLSLFADWPTKMAAFEGCFLQDGVRFGLQSITIAEYLLRNGVDVNIKASGGATALYAASKYSTKRGAEFMKFLLESGADPQINPPGKKSIKDRPGPRRISKWFGISWEQLVEESQEKYAASLKTRESR